MQQRVVITGLGLVTPIGIGKNAFWQSVREGRCGIGPISAFDAKDYKVRLAAEVHDFNPADYMDKKETRRTDRFCQFALAASELCLQDAGLEGAGDQGDSFGVYIASGVGGMQTLENEHGRLRDLGPARVSPLMVPMIIGNMASGLVAIRYGLKGPSASFVTACASAITCIGEAYEAIRCGRARRMLAGGAEAAITPLAMAGFSNLTALTHTDDVERASIPFDRERTGFVMGEGAGILLLETYEDAKERGAHIYAEILGYGATTDAYHMTAPSPDGSGTARAMEMALAQKGIPAGSVDYINAHGTSTPANDSTETKAIHRVFGEDTAIPVSSTKSMTGHLLGAAGAMETAVCALAIQDGFIPANIHYREPDPECNLNIVTGAGLSKPVSLVMKNAMGFGGHNAALLLGALDRAQ